LNGGVRLVWPVPQNLEYQQMERPSGLGGHWWLYVAMGVLSLLGGFFALVNPYAASVVVLQIVAFLFIFLGVMQVAFTLRTPFGLSWFDLGMGVLQILLGVMLATNVLGGLVSLTLILAFLFLIEGVVLCVAGINLRPFRPWLWLVLGGVISILLAVFVLMNLPEAAATLLGLLLGIDLMSNGLWLVAAGLMLRNL
jgi:uncharacterized membrane protein HdeD (DUF308 family)